jgi:predicted RNA-binding Zn-ribbon protein involved in translation (DUF1610 family)
VIIQLTMHSSAEVLDDSFNIFASGSISADVTPPYQHASHVTAIPGLDYIPVFDQSTEYGPVASVPPPIDSSVWDAILATPFFNDPSFLEDFKQTFVSSPTWASSDLTAPSSTRSTSSTQDDSNTVVCRWAGCGAMVEKSWVYQHMKIDHPGEIVNTTQKKRPCRWIDCTHSSKELRRHVQLHYGVEIPCDQCGDTVARIDALRKHQRVGACTKCPWCRHRFASVEKRVAHVPTCPQLGVVPKAGRARRVGKIPSAAH